MPYQLLYTSVPTGLRPGTSGYTTAAHTEGMPGELVSALESKSGYDHLATKDASFNGVNPIISRFEILQLNCGTFFVMSRLQDSGADHTGRTNYLAQHLVIDTTDLMALQMNPEINPASILALGLNPPAQADGTIWRAAGPVKTEHLAPMDTQSFIQRVQQLGGAVNLSGGAAYWRECNLSPAQAPALLEGGRQTKCCLSYAPGHEAHLLRLISETLRIAIERENPTNGQKRSPQEAWRYPFSVFVQSGGSHQEFVWCGFAGPAQQEAVAAGNQMVDLFGGQMPQATDARLSSFAETGAEPYVEPPAPEPQQPVAAQPVAAQSMAAQSMAAQSMTAQLLGGPKTPVFNPPGGTPVVQPAVESGNDQAFLQAQQQAFALQAAGAKKARRNKLLKLAAGLVLLAGIAGAAFTQKDKKWVNDLNPFKDKEEEKGGQKTPENGNAGNGLTPDQRAALGGSSSAQQQSDNSNQQPSAGNQTGTENNGGGSPSPPAVATQGDGKNNVNWTRKEKGELDKRLDFYFKSKGKTLTKIYVLNDFDLINAGTVSRGVSASVIPDIAAFFSDCSNSEEAKAKIKEINIQVGLLHYDSKPEPVMLAFAGAAPGIPEGVWTQQGAAPGVWKDATKKDATKFRLCSVDVGSNLKAGFFEFPSPYKGAYYIDFTKGKKTIRVIVGLHLAGIQLGEGFIKKVPKTGSYEIYQGLGKNLKANAKKFYFLEPNVKVDRIVDPLTSTLDVVRKEFVLVEKNLVIGEINGVAAFRMNTRRERTTLGRMDSSVGVFFKPNINSGPKPFTKAYFESLAKKMIMNKEWDSIKQVDMMKDRLWKFSEHFGILSIAEPTHIRIYKTKDGPAFITRLLTNIEINKNGLVATPAGLGENFFYSIKIAKPAKARKDEEAAEVKKMYGTFFDTWTFGQLLFEGGQVIRIFLLK